MNNDSHYNQMIKVSKTWDLYQERAFKENLFCQRFNFFLVTYTIILATAATLKDNVASPIILIFGIINFDTTTDYSQRYSS